MNNKSAKILILFINIVIYCLAIDSYAFDYDEILPYGPGCKLLGISSAVCENHGFSLLTNPSNLNKNNKINIDFAYIDHTQTYEHPDFDQVYLNIKTPFVALAYTYVINPKWTLALSIYPSKIGSYKINGVPRRLSNINLAFKIKYKMHNIKYALGGKYLISPDTALGMSIILIEEKSWITLSTTNTDKALFNNYAYNYFIKPIAGLNINNLSPFQISVLFSMSPPLIKTYKGSTKILEDTNIKKPTKKEYEPWTISLGLKFIILKDLENYLTLNYEAWALGKKHFQDIIVLSDQTYADLKDIINLGLSLKYNLKSYYNLYLSYAHKNSPWKEGVYDPSYNTQSIGADFDKLNSVNKNIFTLGLDFKYRGIDCISSLYYSLGKRETSMSSNAPGYYQYQTVSLNVGLSKTL